jgi:hypothetical protein
MRFAIIAVAVAALSLVACSGRENPTAGPRPEDTPVETPESTGPLPTDSLPTFESSENTLIETPEYTGVIFTRKGALEFSFLFNQASVGFWEPSVKDVSSAERCIKQYLESMRDDPELDARPEAHAAFILENLGRYRRQYVGIVVNGERRIWINAFFAEDSYPEWQRRPVYVLDGGNYYWDIAYVLPTDACIDFHVHGEA